MSWGRALDPRARATRSMLDSGTMASSATFGMSGVGRLSITNQPRSSSASATVDRPAPESPAMTANSVNATASRGPGIAR